MWGLDGEGSAPQSSIPPDLQQEDPCLPQPSSSFPTLTHARDFYLRHGEGPESLSRRPLNVASSPRPEDHSERNHSPKTTQAGSESTRIPVWSHLTSNPAPKPSCL